MSPLDAPGACSCGNDGGVISNAARTVHCCTRCGHTWPAAPLRPGVARAVLRTSDAPLARTVLIGPYSQRPPLSQTLDDLEGQLRAAQHWGDTVCDARDRIVADLEAAHRRIEYLEGALGDAEERLDDLLADVADEHESRIVAEERASELGDKAGTLETELRRAHETMGRMVRASERIERDARRGRR